MEAVPHVMAMLDRDGMIEPEPFGDTPPPDLTREPMELPASRADQTADHHDHADDRRADCEDGALPEQNGGTIKCLSTP